MKRNLQAGGIVIAHPMSVPNGFTVRRSLKPYGNPTLIGFWLLSSLLLLHAFLGLLPKRSFVATAYALVVVIAAIVLACSKRDPLWALCAAAYIVGAEVLWRATRVGFIWELGKYAVCIVLMTGAIRQGRLRLTTSLTAYFLLLVPAAIITLISLDWYTARRMVSANLSGPLTILVCCSYCRGLTLSRNQVVSVMVSVVLPLVAVASRAAIGIATTEVEWGTESNWSSSGGFGPNQVSAMLGLGGFGCLTIVVLTTAYWQRLAFGGLALWFASQSALTFSRTGFYLLCLSTVAAGIFFVRDQKTRLKFAAVGLAALLVVTFIIYPALDTLTGGNLTARFSETNASNRKEIAFADLRIWQKNLLFGTGIGQGAIGRGEFGFEGSAAHTEYTRLLAEHGLLGLLALCIILSNSALSFLVQRSVGKGLVAGCLIWGLAFLAVSAMRLAAPSFLLGLCCCRMLLDRSAVATRAPLRPSGCFPLPWKFASSHR